MSTFAVPSFNVVGVASTVLSTLSSGLHSVGGAAAAIVVVTVLVRLALHPLTRAAVRGERGRTRLAPRVAEITRRHRGDPLRSAQETRDLYRAEGISPLAGMLPVLIQIPVFLVLYRLFSHPTGALAGAHLFGVPLSARLAGGLAGPAAIVVFGALLLALAALAWGNSRRAGLMARAVAAGTPPAPPVSPGKAGHASAPPAPQAKAGKAGHASAPPAPRGLAGTGRVATAQVAPPAPDLTRMMALLGRYGPYLLLVSGMVLPLAAGIYLVTTTAWSLAENTLLRRGLP